MLRTRVCVLSFCLTLFVQAAPARAGTFFYCVVQDYNGRETHFVSDLREADVDKIDTTYTGFAYSDEIAPQWSRMFPGNASRKSYCSSSTNRAYIEKERAQLLGQNPNARQVAFTKSPVASKPAKPQSGLILTMPTTKPSGGTKESPAKPPASTADAERTRNAERDRREAEWQAKIAAHEAEVADYQRKVKARQEEIARQQREHAAAQNEAARAKAEFDRKQAAHSRLIEEHTKRQMEYVAARNRQVLCVNGNKQACAEITGAKSAPAEKIADAGEPATSDDEARTCVTDPVLGPSKVWKGALAATVINGCKTAVDARICLLREGGWNCGVYWGLKPQQRWTWTSFKATGDLFWDARMTGSGRPLGEP